MRKGRYHCLVGPVMTPPEAETVRKIFSRKGRWLPGGTLIAPIRQLADRYDCPHRFSCGPGQHYCTSTCYLKNFRAGAGLTRGGAGAFTPVP